MSVKNSLLVFLLLFFIIFIQTSLSQTEKEIGNIFKLKTESIEQKAQKVNWITSSIEYDAMKTNSILYPIQGEIKFVATKILSSGELDTKTYPVIVKLYWFEEDKAWVVNKVLAKSFGKWSEPEKDSGWRYGDKSIPGYKMENLINELKNIFSQNSK